MSVPLRWKLRWRLSLLWLLEWGITGALLTYLPLYFTRHGLPLEETGPLLAVGAVGLWVAPIVTGQICDRWMNIERYLALAHLGGGITLLAIPVAVQAEWFDLVFWLLGLFAALYLPTMPLASALTFRHLPHPDLQFGSVRVWGTIGWILAGVGLSVWLQWPDAQHWLRETIPASERIVSRVDRLFRQLPGPTSDDAFHIAAILSFALSSFCVFLPPTPPARTVQGGFAPLAVLRLFVTRPFLVLAVFSFLLGMVIPLYSLAVPPLLEQQKFHADWVPAVMTIGQISEFPALLLLPSILKRFGLRGTFLLGIAAWGVRYALFASDPPVLITLLAVALHGVCHVFVIIVIQLFIDAHCPPDRKASAQNLFAFLTLGVAMPIGLLLSRPLVQASRDASGEVVNFSRVFGIPALLLAIAMALFWLVMPQVKHDLASEPSQ
ncbi:MAG: MFS transporter [Planctomycetaceae bacterium]|nr:MFS transporter [Planctomycetaceae bacterium]